MKLINLKIDNIPFATSYFDIPQPMPIYHSTEELSLNLINEPYHLFSSISDIAEMFRMEGNQKFKERFKQRKVLIATSETVVPEAFNNQGDIVFKLTNYNVTITDNCYVQLYDVIPVTPGVCHMITSAGIQAFFQDGTGGDLSAAVRPQFKNVRGWDRRFQKNKRERKKTKLIDNYTNSRATLPLDYKLMFHLLNPLNKETFLNTHKAAHATFDGQKGSASLKNQDIADIMNSERIQNLIYREMKKIMPELLNTVKGDISPTMVAQWLKKLGDDALANPDLSVKDKILAISATVQVGYADENVVLTTDIDKPPALPILTPGGIGGQQLIQPSIVTPSGGLSPYSDEDIVKKELHQPKDELDSENLKERIDTVEYELTDERKEELKQAVDLMEDYVQHPVSKPHNPNSPLVESDKNKV